MKNNIYEFNVTGCINTGESKISFESFIANFIQYLGVSDISFPDIEDKMLDFLDETGFELNCYYEVKQPTEEDMKEAIKDAESCECTIPQAILINKDFKEMTEYYESKYPDTY